MTTRELGLLFLFLGVCSVVIGMILWSNPVYDKQGRQIPTRHESIGVGMMAGGAVLIVSSMFMIDND